MSSLQDELSSIDENDGKPNENTMNSFLQLSQFEAPKNVQLFDELGQNTFPPHHICLEVISAQKGEVKGQSLSEINFFSFPDHDQLDYIQPVFIAQQIKAQTQQRYQTKKKTCKCKKSNCMKDYCECYQYGEICSPHTCGCENCFNIVQNETLSQKRRRYQQKQNNYSYRICTCRRNQCSSKHCQCKRNGKHCGPQCQCVGCSNQSIAKEGKREVTQQIRKLRKAKISAKF